MHLFASSKHALECAELHRYVNVYVITMCTKRNKYVSIENFCHLPNAQSKFPNGGQ